MTDTELIEELRWALDEETTGVWAGDDLAARARSRAWRRRALRGLLASLRAAGIATGLLVAGLPGTTATPAGNRMPVVVLDSKPGRPDSARVASSGMTAERCDVVTPSARTLPALIKGNADGN